MKKTTLASNSILIFVSLVWGLGFIPQRLGLETLEPMGFNFIRFILGALVLLPVILYSRSFKLSLLSADALRQGQVLGFLLALGAGFQQVSIGLTSIANVAFITGFYVIFVPIFGFVLGHRYSGVTWLGGVIALVGLGFLSGFGGELSLSGDLIALIGAVFWAAHLLAITHFVKSTSAYVLAFYQFLFCALFSLGFSLGFESHVLPTSNDGYLWAAVNGILVVGIAYTLQVAVLKTVDPFIASLIFSLESVFGAIAGYWVFAEILGWYGILGAGLMLVGCVMAQLPEKVTNKSIIAGKQPSKR